MNKIITLLIAIFTSFLASCAMDPSQKEEEALAKSFAPQPGRANVYVYRPRTLTPWVPTPYVLYLNGKDVGPTPDADNKFIMLDVPSGEHAVTIRNMSLLGKTHGLSEYKFTAKSSENIFLKFKPLPVVNVIVLSTPVVSWSRVTEVEGKKDILKSQLVQGIETVN